MEEEQGRGREKREGRRESDGRSPGSSVPPDVGVLE